MKNILFTLVLWLFTFTTSAQQSWQVVGQPGFSEGMPQPFLFPQSLALDNNGVPYVAYAEYISEEDGARGVVKKFENNSWQTVGDDFYTNWGDLFIYASLVFNSNNVPYIAYTDQSNMGKVTVKKLESGNWQQVDSWVSDNFSGYSSLAFDNDDIPYVSYRDGANSSKVTVKKFENNSWQIVGEAGFSTDAVYDYIPLVFDSNNVPYVAYPDYIEEENISFFTVMKFENNSWQTIPTEGILDTFSISLAIDSTNTLYMAYKRNITLGGLYELGIKKFVNSTWQNVGEQGMVDYGNIRLTLFNDVPYIVFTDMENNHKATVKKFENGSWQMVGEAGFTESYVYGFSFSISNNGVPYVAFHDNTNNQKVTVMKYDNTMSVDEQTTSNISLYPNPANNIITIDNIPENSTIKVFDITGKLIYDLQTADKQVTINTANLINGIYLVQITDNHQKTIKKLIIQ